LSATGGGEATQSAGARLGFTKGTVVQELGWDEDVDDDLRIAIEDDIDADMVDGDYGNVVDSVLLWWRDEDGDLVDALVDSLTDLVAGGVIWLLTPKMARPNAVEPAREATLELLRDPDPPTAILAMTDTLAFGALEAAAELGVSVPAELSIVGFDDTPAARGRPGPRDESIRGHRALDRPCGVHAAGVRGGGAPREAVRPSTPRRRWSGMSPLGDPDGIRTGR